MKRRRKLALALTGALVAVFAVFIVLFLTTRYAAADDAVAILQDPPGTMEVRTHPRVIEISDRSVGLRAEFVFYPGNKIDPVAYLPLAAKIAEKGIRVWITMMPSDLPAFGIRRFAKVRPLLDQSLPVLLGGHDIGAAVAARLLSRQPDGADGLVMLAAVPGRSIDLSKVDIDVLAITGTDDALLDGDRFSDSRALYAEGARLYEISGGNHSGYGDYGQQRGDGTASIASEEQQAIVAKLVADLVADL